MASYVKMEDMRDRIIPESRRAQWLPAVVLGQVKGKCQMAAKSKHSISDVNENTTLRREIKALISAWALAADYAKEHFGIINRNFIISFGPLIADTDEMYDLLNQKQPRLSTIGWRYYQNVKVLVNKIGDLIDDRQKSSRSIDRRIVTLYNQCVLLSEKMRDIVQAIDSKIGEGVLHWSVPATKQRIIDEIKKEMEHTCTLAHAIAKVLERYPNLNYPSSRAIRQEYYRRKSSKKQ